MLKSTGNVENRWLGRVDFPLSEAGRSQADRLRCILAQEGYSPTRIYTSPLSRALETAQIASSGWHCPIELWNDLIEIDVGVISDLTAAGVEEQFPEVAHELVLTRNYDLVDGAETYEERTVRMKRLVDRLIRDHDNADRVLLFSHGGIMAHFITQLLGTDQLWYISIQNTAIFEFAIDVNSWYLDAETRADMNLRRIIRFNDSAHLGDNR